MCSVLSSRTLVINSFISRDIKDGSLDIIFGLLCFSRLLPLKIVRIVDLIALYISTAKAQQLQQPSGTIDLRAVIFLHALTILYLIFLHSEPRSRYHVIHNSFQHAAASKH